MAEQKRIITPGQGRTPGLAVPAHLMQPQGPQEVMERIERFVGSIKKLLKDKKKKVGCTVCGGTDLIITGTAPQMVMQKHPFAIYMVCDHCKHVEMFEVPADKPKEENVEDAETSPVDKEEDEATEKEV